ncbi:alpha/beta hydrolase family protein [Draconibacterium mangrovi]|uniref:alpha/beta hydrolase family protein n=1 Tax=Draconibacterium mangrovi TaxID=2697469 RepID=UPI0013D011F1|nr:alpha/beta hydrolase [Draconibacterium mangrovi]
MKTVFILLLMFLITLQLNGQNITGEWYGLLAPQGEALRITLDVEQTKRSYKTTLYSIDQTSEGFEMKRTKLKDSTYTTKAFLGLFGYSGILSEDSIKGTFKQFGMEFPLVFTRNEIEKPVFKRAQEPVLPLPYYTEDIKFANNSDRDTLAGTLSLPDKEGKYPVVILISGSGPQNRDEELARHKPFLVLSDYLTRKGIAVLRYDDRGFGESTGCHECATTADFASDVKAAIEYLKSRNEIDIDNIGLIGHSEGGMIAPMVASENSDVGFIVTLAAPGVSLKEIILKQNELISRAEGESEEKIAMDRSITEKALNMIAAAEDVDVLEKQLSKYLKKEARKNKELIKKESDVKEYVNSYLLEYANIWMIYALNYNAAKYFEKVQCPSLILNGAKDLQVDSEDNLPVIEKAFQDSGNKEVKIIEYPNLNHLFQECNTGSPSEYSSIEETISPTVLDDIKTWIKSIMD